MYDGKNGKGIVVVTDMVNRRLIQIVQIGNHSSLDKNLSISKYRILMGFEFLYQ